MVTLKTAKAGACVSEALVKPDHLFSFPRRKTSLATASMRPLTLPNRRENMYWIDRYGIYWLNHLTHEIGHLRTKGNDNERSPR